MKREVYKRLGKRYLRDRDPTLLHSYARQVERRLAASDCDIVVSPGSIPLSYVRTDKPMAFWTDISFAAMAEYYPEFSNLPARTLPRGKRRRAGRAVGVHGRGLRVGVGRARGDQQLRRRSREGARRCPLGANITEAPTRAEVEQMLAARSRDMCTLLFLAGAWERKGGRKAFEVTEALNAAGIPTELVVCGGAPADDVLASPHVTYLGYVSKGTPEGLAQWTTMLAGAHFYVLPSLQEAFGSATCEANAYGLPGLVNDVGGTAGAVTNGVNGQLFDPDAPAAAWVEFIAPLWSDPDRYAALALSSVDEHAGRLNWETGCRAVVDMLLEA